MHAPIPHGGVHIVTPVPRRRAKRLGAANAGSQSDWGERVEQ